MYKMMIIDDESIVVEGIRDTIPWIEYGIDVGETAENGIEALEKLQTYHPDIILVDIRMPEMDGLLLIEKAKAIQPAVKFIIISAFEQFSYAQRAIELGVRFYLVKPLLEQDIVEKVQLCIAEIETEKNQNQEQNELERFQNNQAAQYIIGCWLSEISVDQDQLISAFNQLGFPYDKDYYCLALLRPIPSGGPYSSDTLKRINKHLSEFLMYYLLFEYSNTIIVCLFVCNTPIDQTQGKILPKIEKLFEQSDRGLDAATLLDLLPRTCSLSDCPRMLFRMLSNKNMKNHKGGKNAGQILPLDSGESLFHSRIIRDACNYMNSRAYLDISLIGVAKHVSLSPTYLSALFKQEMGISFIEYLKHHRVERAKHLLVQTNLKVYEICSELGYKSVQYFTTLFKESVGMTPMEYREALCK